MLVMCSGDAPVVVSVCDCTDHMVAGKKEDTEYIRKFFQKKVDEWDEVWMYTDYFFFDCATNVQKAGAILCATYPWAMCCHGGKHVLSLSQWPFKAEAHSGKYVGYLFIYLFILYKCNNILRTCQLYNVFGSGLNHSIHHNSLHKPILWTMDVRLVYCGERELALPHYSMPFIDCCSRKWHWKQPYMELHFLWWPWIAMWLMLCKMWRMKYFGRLFMSCCRRCIQLWRPYVSVIQTSLTLIYKKSRRSNS